MPGVMIYNTDRLRSHSELSSAALSSDDLSSELFGPTCRTETPSLGFGRSPMPISPWPTVEFDVPIDQIREVDPKTGREIAVNDDSPDMNGLQLSLDSGASRLSLLPAASAANRRE
jgi:hypothetical protein